MEKKEIGNWGEDAACRHLQEQGNTILVRNYHSRYGEIDIIATDGEYTAFVEVKTRKSSNFGTPAEFVTPQKQKKLIKTAQVYLGDVQSAVRFDVAEVFYHIQGETPVLERVNYIENAFGVEL